MVRLRTIHQALSVTVNDVTHHIELDPVEGGWFEGDVAEEVAEKCVRVARTPDEYQVVGGIQQEEPPTMPVALPDEPDQSTSDALDDDEEKSSKRKRRGA